MSAEELNRALKKLRQPLTIEGTLFFGQDSGASSTELIGGTLSWEMAPIPGKFVVDSDTQQVVHDPYVLDAKPVEPLTVDEYIETIQAQLPEPLDATPVRMNQETYGRLCCHPALTKLETTTPFGVPWGILVVVDDSLSDGVIMRGDKVLCNAEEG